MFLENPKIVDRFTHQTSPTLMKFYKFTALLRMKVGKSGNCGVDEAGLDPVSVFRPHPDGGAIEAVNGFVLPGFQNAHSHAFQFAMAGLAEKHSSGEVTISGAGERRCTNVRLQ
jgi:hypothetical protein